MRPLDKASYNKNEMTYNPYGNAKDDLIKALGSFCSYCERCGFSSALDVEHIEDKKTFPAKKYNWDNFLLACTNCNSIKKNKSVANIPLPHIENTFELFDYLESGVIQVKNILDLNEKKSAEKLIQLVGLDRFPGHVKYSRKDKRWLERKKAWELSKRYLVKFNEGKCDIETVVDLALREGFWSIWMIVFIEHSNVQKELILKFNGTKLSFFEELLV